MESGYLTIGVGEAVGYPGVISVMPRLLVTDRDGMAPENAREVERIIESDCVSNLTDGIARILDPLARLLQSKSGEKLNRTAVHLAPEYRAVVGDGEACRLGELPEGDIPAHVLTHEPDGAQHAILRVPSAWIG